eukprot:GHVU01103697.1.p1 GENE.GHVU01103697.1~~GHVU01103697.1.p1  ORF type:complete len:154 (+),score=9.31 GHVU01103697.1:355-816(+)
MTWRETGPHSCGPKVSGRLSACTTGQRTRAPACPPVVSSVELHELLDCVCHEDRFYLDGPGGAGGVRVPVPKRPVNRAAVINHPCPTTQRLPRRAVMRLPRARRERSAEKAVAPPRAENLDSAPTAEVREGNLTEKGAVARIMIMKLVSHHHR